MNESYKNAGVDVHAGYAAVEMMKKAVQSTYTGGVVGGIGGFGGMFRPDIAGMTSPVLVSGTDSVGTKIKLAFSMDKHDTIGIDCVAMCVNDVVCTGAKPLFFLDYIGCNKLVPEKIASIVEGVAEGCRQAGCALIGGETAEMPSLYAENEYDLAGFCVGMADEPKLITPKAESGDVVIGLASSGVHSNGYALVRKLVGDDSKSLGVYVPELGMSAGEALLTPTRIYVKTILALMEKLKLRGVANITGGGWYENMPRMLPDGVGLRLKAAKIPPVFRFIQALGDVPREDMYNTFNMGVGMVICVSPDEADAALRELAALGENAMLLGEVVAGEKAVEIVW